MRTVLGHFLLEAGLRMGLLAEERFIFLDVRGEGRLELRDLPVESLIRLLYVSSYLNSARRPSWCSSRVTRC